MKKINLPIASVSLAVLLVVGCGGGSGSGSVDRDPAPNPPGGGTGGSALSVSGVASKGLLKYATVTAFELDDAGTRSSESVGSTETDASGAYELELSESYAGGLIEIEVSVIAGKTRMVCDAAQCGSVKRLGDVELPEDFKLTALVEKPADVTTVNASVTAWSTMAAKRAKAIQQAEPNTSLKAATKRASAEVSQILGFDVAKTEAKDISQLQGLTGAQAQYAVMNAAVAEILFEGGADNLTAKLDGFTAALADDGVLGAGEDAFNTQDLASAVRQVMESSPELDASASDALENQTAQYEAAGEDGFKPDYDADLDVDDGADQATKIAAYREFVSQVRTWVSSIQALDADGMNEALNIDAETVQAILDANVQNQFQFLGEIMEHVNTYVITNTKEVAGFIANGGSKTLDITNGSGATVGAVELTFADDDGLKISLFGEVTGEGNTTFLPFHLTLDTSFPVDSLTLTKPDGDALQLALARALSANHMTLTGAIEDGLGNDSLAINELSVKLELNEAVNLANASAETLASLMTAASFTGDVAISNQGASFSGSVDLQLVRLGESAALFQGAEANPVSVKKMSLSGAFTSADGASSFSTSASLNVRNAASFDTFAWLEHSETTIHIDGVAEQSILIDDIPELAGLRYLSATLSAWFAEEQPSSELHYGGYALDGREVGYSRDLTSSELATIAADLAATVTPAVPVDLTLSYYGSDGELQELPVAAPTLLGSGDIQQILVEENGVLLEYLLDLSETLPAGAIPISLTGSGVEGLFYYDSPTGGAWLDLNTTAVSVVDAVASVASKWTVEGADVGTIRIGRNAQYISSSFVPTLAHVDSCVADPRAVLTKIGAYINPVQELQLQCVQVLMSYTSHERELTAEEAEAWKVFAKQKLLTKFNGDQNLVDRVEIDSFHAWSGEQEDALSYVISAEMPDLDMAEKFMDLSFTLSARVDVPELRSAQVAATISRTSYRGATMTTNVKWNGGNYTLVLSSDNLEEPTNINARFFNSQGYELHLTGGLEGEGQELTLTGDALMNGEKIGYVELRDGSLPVIVYANGDEEMFESLL